MDNSETFVSEDGNVIVTSMSLDELFVAMQKTDADKAEAREWIKNNPIPKNEA